MKELWPWLVLVGLGMYHGLNPAMGWLFAVALGLHRQSRAVVLQSLIPIALGHAGSIAAVAFALAATRVAVEPRPLRLAAAALLISFGLYRLVKGYRHKFRAGMQVGFVDLAVWSFLMATAHGAGLMLLPALLALPGGHSAALHADAHMSHMSSFGGSMDTALVAVLVHTAAMLVATGAIALVVFDRIGLAFLRRGWINLDLLWSLLLLGSGALMIALEAGAG